MCNLAKFKTEKLVGLFIFKLFRERSFQKNADCLNDIYRRALDVRNWGMSSFIYACQRNLMHVTDAPSTWRLRHRCRLLLERSRSMLI